MKTIHAVETEFERLGRYAAECDLWAADPDMSPWDRNQLAERAENYRSRQVLLMSGLHRCGTDGCLAMVAGSTRCRKCMEEDMMAVPYTFANVLKEFPLWARRLMALSLFVGVVALLALASIVL